MPQAARPEDVCQGALGNCWFAGALSVVAQLPELIDRICVTKAGGSRSDRETSKGISLIVFQNMMNMDENYIINGKQWEAMKFPGLVGDGTRCSCAFWLKAFGRG